MVLPAEVSAEEMSGAAASVETTPGVEAPGQHEGPWEVAVDAVASISEGAGRPWRREGSVREGTWAMVQPGIPPAFERNERKESEAWEGYDQANYDIERALAFALDIHRGFHLQVGDVSIVLQLVPLRFVVLCSRPSTLQQLKQMSSDKSDELAQ